MVAVYARIVCGASVEAENSAVPAASPEVEREARREKSDGIDGNTGDHNRHND